MSEREFVAGRTEDIPSTFLFDDSLPAIQRLQKFATSSVPVQRHVYSRRLAATYKENPSIEIVQQILPILDRLLNDSEVLIRVSTVQEIPAFAKALVTQSPPPPSQVECATPIPSFCDLELRRWQSHHRINIREFDVICLDRDEYEDEAPNGSFSSASVTDEGAKASSTTEQTDSVSSSEPMLTPSATLSEFPTAPEYDCVRTHLISLLVGKLSDAEAQVRQCAIDSLLSCSQLLHPDDRVRFVFKPLLDLTQNGNRDESKCLALSLMSMLACHVEGAFNQGFTVPTLQFLSQDTAFRVRKTAASSIGQVALCCTSQDLRAKLVCVEPVF